MVGSLFHVGIAVELGLDAQPEPCGVVVVVRVLGEGCMLRAAATFLIKCLRGVPVLEGQLVGSRLSLLVSGAAAPSPSFPELDGEPHALIPDISPGRLHKLSDSGQPGDLQPTLPRFNLFKQGVEGSSRWSSG